MIWTALGDEELNSVLEEAENKRITDFNSNLSSFKDKSKHNDVVTITRTSTS